MREDRKMTTEEVRRAHDALTMAQGLETIASTLTRLAGKRGEHIDLNESAHHEGAKILSERAANLRAVVADATGEA